MKWNLSVQVFHLQNTLIPNTCIFPQAEEAFWLKTERLAPVHYRFRSPTANWFWVSINVITT